MDCCTVVPAVKGEGRGEEVKVPQWRTRLGFVVDVRTDVTMKVADGVGGVEIEDMVDMVPVSVGWPPPWG